MRRGVLMVLAAVAAIGVFAGGLGWLLTDARPPAGAPRAQRLYYAYCAECHGVHGRGPWRASLFLLRPSDLTDPRVATRGAGRSPLALDPDEADLVAGGPHGAPHAIAGRDACGVERRGRAAHGHHLHGPHAERGDGLMADQQEVGGGAGDDLSAD